MMKISVVIKTQFEGIHCWPSCNIADVDFLKQKHRHIFHVCAEKQVTNTDREIEFIQLKRQVDNFLGHLDTDLGSMSCEDIAILLMETFDLCYCEVTEDGENGARVYS